jgi:hypothetical protein
MKSIIARKPHLTARTAISLSLQILLVVLLRQHYQDSLLFNLGILLIAILAVVPVAFAPRWLPFWPRNAPSNGPNSLRLGLPADSDATDHPRRSGRGLKRSLARLVSEEGQNGPESPQKKLREDSC